MSAVRRFVQVAVAAWAGLPAAAQPLAGGRLPTSFNNIIVVMGGLRAPLYYVSANQINAQVPYELMAGQQYQTVVRFGSAYSVPQPVTLAATQPGVAAFDDGRIIAQDENFQLITDSQPARRGSGVIVYLVGLGPTVPAVETGVIAPASPLAQLNPPPEVTVDGKPARVLFAGLTPGFVGLYQINLVVPADATPGLRELVVRQGGIRGNVTMIPVQ